MKRAKKREPIPRRQLTKAFREFIRCGERMGLSDVQIIYHGSGHPRLIGLANGRSVCVVVPSTPRDADQSCKRIRDGIRKAIAKDQL